MKERCRYAVEWLDAATVKKYPDSDDFDPDTGEDKVKYFAILAGAIAFGIKLYNEKADYWCGVRVCREVKVIHYDYDGSIFTRWEESHYLYIGDWDKPEEHKFTIKDFTRQNAYTTE